jgi:hypothetical protein
LLRRFVLLRFLAALPGFHRRGVALIKIFFAKFAFTGIFLPTLVLATLVFVRLGMRRAETVVAGQRAFLGHLLGVRIFLAIVACGNGRLLIISLRTLRLILVRWTTTVIKTVATATTTTPATTTITATTTLAPTMPAIGIITPLLRRALPTLLLGWTRFAPGGVAVRRPRQRFARGIPIVVFLVFFLEVFLGSWKRRVRRAGALRS